MTWGKVLGYVAHNVMRSRRQFILASLGIVAGIAAFVFFMSLSLGARTWILKLFPLEEVEVVAPAASLAGMDLTKTINDASVDAIREQNAAPIATAMPRMSLRFPIMVSGWFNGQRLVSEFLGDGIDPAFVDDPSIAKLFKDWEAEEHKPLAACADSTSQRCESLHYCDARDNLCHHNVPVIVSPALLEIFNKQYAPSRGLPIIGKDVQAFMRMRGGLEKVKFYFDLGEGQDPASSGSAPRRVEATLVGVHDRAIGLGATLPIQYTRSWNREYAGNDAAQNYSSIVVTLKNKDDTAALGAWVAKNLNLRLEDSRGEKFALIVSVVTLLFLSISLVIVLLAALNIAHTFFSQVSERRSEIGLLRALGATERDVRRIIIGEAAWVGLVGGLVGIGTGLGLIALADQLFSTQIPDFPFKPESLFITEIWVMVLGLTLAMAFAILGGYLPARRAAAMEPAGALASR